MDQFDDIPINEKLLVLDDDLRVIYASPAFRTSFGFGSGEMVLQRLSEFGNGQWNIPALLAELNELAPTDGRFDAFELNSEFSVVGPRKLLLYARRSSGKGDGTGTILLGIDDVTGRPASAAGLVQHTPPLILDMDQPIP